jgi:ribonuclease HII
VGFFANGQEMVKSKLPIHAPVPAEWLPPGLDPTCARIAGADEVGRGSGAGPFLAASVIIPAGLEVPADLDDSKRFDPRGARIAQLAAWVEEHCVVHSALFSVEEIDSLGIGRVNVLAFERLIEINGADFTIVDGNLHLASGRPFRCETKAERFAAVAAASIWAKVTRDRLMNEIAAAYPGYGLESAGYLTAEAIEAIRVRGRIPGVHRVSFRIRGLDY